MGAPQLNFLEHTGPWKWNLHLYLVQLAWHQIRFANYDEIKD